MEIWLWAAVGILTLGIAILTIKLVLLQKATDEICRAFTDRLTTDTNTLIDISSRDRHIRRLASTINVQLRHLRVERQRFQQGDAELKDAITHIAHDLRTPLTAISGYLQLLDGEERPEAVVRYLELMQNRVAALIRLTEEFFRYSLLASARTLTPEPVTINDLLGESLAAAYDLLSQKGIQPQIVIPEQKIERHLDRSALSRVFENIISNAAKYSDGDFGVSLHTDGTIRFCNTATGLDAVTVGRLFDRFYTVETGHGSTGLGLSIARLLTEQMGGSIGASYQHGTLCIEVRF